MPDNCALYLSTRLAPPPSEIEAAAPGASVRVFPLAPGETCASMEVRWPDVRVVFNRMDRSSPELPRHLMGFQGYVQHLAGEQMTPRIHGLLERAARTRHVLGTVIEPGFDTAGKAWGLVLRIAAAHGGLIFCNSSILDSQGRYYLAANGDHDPASALPVFPSALERKARSEARLQALGIPFIPHLPPVPGDEEALLQPPTEVARRAVALLAVALRGEGLEQPVVLSILRNTGLWDACSPAEQAFLTDPHPDRQALVNAAWRYEALAVMLWALGHLELRPPAAICDVAGIAGFMKEYGLEELVAKAQLRPLPQILEELDFTYRCHWAVVDARASGRPAPGGLDPGVVFERHYALNWLTVHGDEEWDDVTTDT
jgi:uncharacterized protein DUF4272